MSVNRFSLETENGETIAPYRTGNGIGNGGGNGGFYSFALKP